MYRAAACEGCTVTIAATIDDHAGIRRRSIVAAGKAVQHAEVSARPSEERARTTNASVATRATLETDKPK